MLAAATFMHAAGHAGLALLGGAVVVALGGPSPGRLGSTAMDVDPRSLALAGIAVSVLRLAGSTMGAYASARMAGDVSTTLRARVLRGLFAVHRLRHPRQADHGGAGSIAAAVELGAGLHARAVSALTSRIREVTLALESGVAACRAALQLLLLAAVVLYVAPKMFLVAAIALAPFGWALGRVRARLRAIQRDEMAHAESLLEAADDAVRYDELWQSFGAERKIQGLLARLGREARDRSAKLDAWSTAVSGTNELLGIVVVAVGLWALSSVAADEAARFAPFAVPFFLAYRPLRDLAEARVALGRASAAAQSLDEVLAFSEESGSDLGDEQTAAWPLATLTLTNVTHPRARFTPLSFSVAPGSIVAIVGKTGCGKTTLIRMLLGLEPRGEGSVYYAGRALDGAEPGPRARPFAWVPQDAPVLSATLDENVRLARAPDEHDAHVAGFDDTRALLESIGAERLLALGNARLGAGHRALSGGERQWLSIARALSSDQPVLLLDEPTSGLDPESERAVLDALVRLRGTRTIVLVTHREAPTAIADRVIRLDEATVTWGGSSPRRRVSAPT